MNQVAATIAHLLGYDYSTNEEAGTVIYNMIANWVKVFQHHVPKLMYLQGKL